MAVWTDGYVVDVAYTHGYYRELTPQLLSFGALAQGIRTLDPTKPLKYCELGCGQGLTANVLAAANPGSEFFATDFNPSQIAGAQRLASDAGLTNIQFFDHSFAEFGVEPKLPSAFDVIALHGVYSWISPENRAHITEFIRNKLRPGGIVYISYNTLPGWAAELPLRNFMVRKASQSGDLLPNRIDFAIAQARELKNAGADYFSSHPLLEGRLDNLGSSNRNYLAHEFFNKDWTPFYFEDVAQELSNAKLTFAATAHILDQIDIINLTAEQIVYLEEINDPLLRQSIRDFMVNQKFRRDIFVKGAETYNQKESRNAWLNCRFALAVSRLSINPNVKTRLGTITLQPEAYDPLLDALANGPATLRDLLQHPKIAAIDWASLQQALAMLIGLGHIHLCLPAQNEKKRRENTAALNREILKRAHSSDKISCLVSPVTGGGLPVNRLEQLFLSSRAAGAKTENDWALSAWTVMKENGQKLTLGGEAVQEDADNMAELRRLAEEFSIKKLPLLCQLKIA